MGAAAQGTAQISPVFDNQGRRWFNMPYTAPNYNDTLVWCSTSNTVWDVANENSLVVTNVEILHEGTVGVELTYIYLATGAGGQQVVYLPHHTTAKAVDVHAVSNLNAFVNTNTLALGQIWLTIWPTGYVNTDDMTIFIRGYIQGTPQTGIVQAVSVEGYKWPLQRRY